MNILVIVSGSLALANLITFHFLGNPLSLVFSGIFILHAYMVYSDH